MIPDIDAEALAALPRNMEEVEGAVDREVPRPPRPRPTPRPPARLSDEPPTSKERMYQLK